MIYCRVILPYCCYHYYEVAVYQYWFKWRAQHNGRWQNRVMSLHIESIMPKDELFAKRSIFQNLIFWYFDVYMSSSAKILSRKAHVLTFMIGQQSDLTYHSRWWIYFDIWSGFFCFFLCKTYFLTKKAYFWAFIANSFAAESSVRTPGTSCTAPLFT